MNKVKSNASELNNVKNDALKLNKVKNDALKFNKVKNNALELKRIQTETARHDKVRSRMGFAATAETRELFGKLGTRMEGLSETLVEALRDKYGENRVTRGEKESLPKRVAGAFLNPFTAILITLAIISVFTDILMAAPEEANFMAVIIITAMVLFSGVLRFVQETRSGLAAENLLKMIRTTTNVRRWEEGNQEIPLEDVVVGDIIHIAAGDLIPADMRIIQAKDLFISQSALTGESVAVEKIATPVQLSVVPAAENKVTPERFSKTLSAETTDGGAQQKGSPFIGKTDGVMQFNETLTEIPNLAFMGTDVISGSAIGVVIATGDETFFGEMAKSVSDKPVKTSFEKGVNAVSWVLIRFMLVMVPIVLFVNGFTKGDWMGAALFAVSIAVGLTPEMLPMIITTCLARGAVEMSRKKTVIKNLNSIQNLGGMDILCTDKTGTLTQDRVVLLYHLNIHGEEDARVLRHAFLNSYYQTGLKNLMDIAIIDKAQEEQDKTPELQGLADRFKKVDEIPFDFERRRMSVVVENGKTQMITKGAVEEMLPVCSFAEYKGNVVPLTDEIKAYIMKKVDDLNEDGMRVIALAQKTNPSPVGAFSTADESDMVLIGYLAFLDPPKESTIGAIKALHEHGVGVKILTGDNDKVTSCVCRQVGLPVDHIILGSELEIMTDAKLSKTVEEASVFAKLSPQQKAKVITALRNNGHSVGYMGDGINDAAGMKASDVGISVDTAVDIAKESADVILLEKDLMVLEQGIVEGRKTYANMIKYIKMTASSNFGNMLAVLVASAFLPFIPMLPIHLILLNLIYDLSCTAIPWDNVDREYLASPRKWDASSIGKFMLWIGPTSSIFDISTYGLLYFVVCPAMVGGTMFHDLTDPALITAFIAVFHAGWFVESMWTQTFVIHMIRTPKIPFIRSRASIPLTLVTFTGIVVLTAIPFTEFGASIGLAALPIAFFPWLLLTVFLYMVLVTVFKRIFVSRYGELL